MEMAEIENADKVLVTQKIEDLVVEPMHEDIFFINFLLARAIACNFGSHHKV